MITTPRWDQEFDFVIVGSGAGGGPLACNLARKRYRVLLIEAGSHEAEDRDTPRTWNVPVLHGRASEDPAISWEYFVKHYADPKLQQRDPKWHKDKSIFYPRSSGIGGCTVHNAMVTMSGPADDWDAIASLVDDRSWNSESMRGYFERLENCHYVRPGYRARRFLGRFYDLMAMLWGNRGRHGFSGWLDTSWANPWMLRKDWQLLRVVLAVFFAARRAQMTGILRMLWAVVSGQLAAELDPNHWERLRKRPEGLALVPMAVKDGWRRSVRDYVLETEKAFPEHLTIWTDTLVTKVRFRENAVKEACGVEFLHGKALYKAHPTPGTDAGTPGAVRARYEVILAAGAFNTPQLLMLSGIGPERELKSHGITPLVPLEGVGTNLQDRYEISVVWKMPKDLELLRGIKFSLDPPDDAELSRWKKTGEGVYGTNGVVLSVLKKSRPDVSMPDLCIFAVPGRFEGYERGYSEGITKDHSYLTWLILKAHTNDRQGTVRLLSADPRDPPAIDFSYFSEGSDVHRDDVKGLVEGIKFVRTIKRFGGVNEIERTAQYETDAELADYVANEAWGHHASCSCPIGPAADPMAVVDANFRVHGVKGLRIVDASVFPQIPGLFIAANIYMLAERATDVIANAYPR
jgi:choline dehydrogenase